jgi:hypothetical protein
MKHHTAFPVRAGLAALGALLAGPLAGAFVQYYNPATDLIPGTSELVDVQMTHGPVLVDGKVVFGISKWVAGQTRTFLLAAGPDGLNTLYDSGDGFPGGGQAAVRGLEGSLDGAFWAVQKSDEPRDGLVQGYDGTVFEAPFARARAAISAGAGSHFYDLAGVSADGEVFALTGWDGNFSHFILRAEGGEVEVIAQESVTVAPGGGEAFEKLTALALSPDGRRLVFHGETAGTEGLYLWDDGSLVKLVTDADDYPGTDKPFTQLWNSLLPVAFGLDGTFYFVRGTNWQLLTDADRVGLFAYTPGGELQLLFDNTTVVEGTGGVPLGSNLTSENFRLHADGTATIRVYEPATQLSHYLWLRDGALERVVSARGTTFGTNGWSIDGVLYLVSLQFAGEFIMELHAVNPEQQTTTRIHRFTSYPTNYRPTSLFIEDGRLVAVSSIIGFAPQIWGAAMTDLQPGPDIPQAAYLLATLATEAPFYQVPTYGRIYAPDENLPWIYVEDPGLWLYVIGPQTTTFRAYSPQYGWVYIRRPNWPWVYLYEGNQGWVNLGG